MLKGSISPALVASADTTKLTDNEVLDEFTIPFGNWIEEAVNWTTNNLGWLLDGIAWPFNFLLDNLVDNFLRELPWLVLVALMMLIAWMVRNLSVAVFTGIGLVICGLLGPNYWADTVDTIGLILVAVLVCLVLGIPIGILSGRIDGVWQVVRPTLDAMQVIHAFVYLLPFVYFWGVGRVAATMATVVFALPPLIRLTNLGIRGVPEDVVEAARAYGAPERRVLTDVQLPLARPAIMTGINQTLLLAFSMLGIAAILGAGGLGRTLFRALGQQDVAVAAASGLAFFILAVILDRISQTGEGDKNLFGRLATAWRARSEPEVLLDDPSFNPEADIASSTDGVIKPIGAHERPAMIAAAIGAIAMLASTVLTWGQGAGLLSGYSRRTDQELAGQAFAGWMAEGGSWFAFAVAAMGLVVLAAVVVAATGWKGGNRWLAPDGAVFAALAGTFAALGYLVTNPSSLTVGYSHGVGPYVAAAGGAFASLGALRWLTTSPYAPRRPLKKRVLPGPVALGIMALTLAVASLFSSWVFDERADAVITPEIQAQIDDLMAAAAAGEVQPGVAATEIQVIRAGAVQAEKIVIDGKAADGPQLGLWVLGFSILGGLAALVAAGVTGFDSRRQWVGSAVAMGCGLGVSMIAIGWVGSLARTADLKFYSGVGSMFAGLAGAFLFFAGQSVAKGFERSKTYSSASAGSGENPLKATASHIETAEPVLTA